MRCIALSTTLALVLPLSAQVPRRNARMPGMQMPAPKAAAPPVAPQRPGWTLAQLETLALERNPTLRQALAAEQEAAGLVRQSGLWPNPTVGYEGDQIRGGSYGGGEQGVFAQQKILLGHKLAAAQRVAAAGLRGQQAIAAAQRLAVRSAVRLAFYRALARQRLVAVDRGLLGIARDAALTTRQLANVGQANPPDELAARVETEQAALALDRARRRLRGAWRELAAVVGSPHLRPGPLAGQLAPGPAPIRRAAYLQRLLSASPAVQIAAAELRRAQATLGQARRQSVPDLTLRGGEQTNRELTGRNGPPVGWQSFASVGIGLPVFNRNQGNVASAAAAVIAAREEIIRVRLRLRRQAAAEWARYRAAADAAARYRVMVPQAERAYRLYLRYYQHMAAAYPQVLVAQRTWFELRRQSIRTLGRLWRSALTLRSQFYVHGLQPAAAMPPITANQENMPNAR